MYELDIGRSFGSYCRNIYVYLRKLRFVAPRGSVAQPSTPEIVEKGEKKKGEGIVMGNQLNETRRVNRGTAKIY